MAQINFLVDNNEWKFQIKATPKGSCCRGELREWE